MFERVYYYWFFLAVLFGVFALLIWFGLIPYGIVEYNLGVNLFTSSVFMVLTIIFLSWLFTVREKNEWKIVKDEIYSMIQDEIGILFNEILNFTENGLMLKISFSVLDKKTRKEASFSELCKLKDATELKLNALELKLLLEGKTPTPLETFLDVAQNLNDIEIKYSRFLPPQLLLSLIKIRHSIRFLETTVKLHINIKVSPTLNKIMPKEIQEMENEIPKIISASFKKLLEEIHNIHKSGIQLSPF